MWHSIVDRKKGTYIHLKGSSWCLVGLTSSRPISELIKYKGYQVAPAELEALLLQHPSISAAGVVGLYSQDEATELPRAYIQLRPNVKQGENTEKEIQQWIKGKVSNAKQLRGGVKIIERVPTNPSGKILRKELRKLVEREQQKRESKL